MSVVDRWRPETAAGGFTRDDEDIAFYTRINALIRPDMAIVDLGAGRGARYDDGSAAFRKTFFNFQGRVKRVIGLDVDPAVLQHPHLDEALTFEPGGRLPLEDGSVDMIICEWVIEHVEHPAEFAREVRRVLKPGGWFCALTPNSWGYVGISNRIVPERFKDWLMRRVWPERPHQDVFPTFYRLNTLGRLRRAFEREHWGHHSYIANSTPRYHGGVSAGFAVVSLFQWLMPPPMRTNLFVFLQKRS
ncbi:class I SAM-dependent methyltransferase [Nitratireductor rhodophyticola]|uniref:class I SAM-dependent methyltransferase n=1 Tax=Nitratireductor rhodophyticola TaxID=2854036 RepID=UPI00300B029B